VPDEENDRLEPPERVDEAVPEDRAQPVKGEGAT